MNKFVPIKFLFFSLLTSLLFTGCAMLNPATQADVLKKYHYDVESVSNLKIAGTALGNTTSRSSSLMSLPGIAVGLLSKNLPLEAIVNMKVSNPTGEVANMGAFKYLIEIQGKPFFEGAVNDAINLGNGQSTVIPLAFKANLFGVTDEKTGVEKLLSDVLTREGNGFVVLKIKPSVKIGGHNIYYPGYITVDNDLLKGIKGSLK
ncbi:hypothetical protein [Olivibacter sp. XZL3]|uniref:hypothetical protein n=1 Tax=Olivibacter sp. XZL3 TaxID=1735116 RepID=UPI0010659283|nr:hypothetical protein [Olivibacter sp. XZL3]